MHDSGLGLIYHKFTVSIAAARYSAVIALEVGMHTSTYVPHERAHEMSGFAEQQEQRGGHKGALQG